MEGETAGPHVVGITDSRGHLSQLSSAFALASEPEGCVCVCVFVDQFIH